MTTQMPESNPLADVEVGMPVIDRENEQLGTVAALKFGDPQAITAEGQQAPRGLAEVVVDSFTGSEPDVPRQLAEKLLRTGYIKIDAKGLFSTDLYAGADQVDRVAADGVRLAVPRHHLVPES
ncbi:hypothetical protein B0I31_102350 [Saccharothrix carnea]|uniref:PRC-barrel domain protein n=1 Tax=Saccharothrix carnea TaxID=1280637 RepID=A0A2P8IFY5_SACCR|nr:hypothetical protein [Saccharothrix carnea]PSL57372.1 hypothetical protein B0I31_102350 [Saccharothrix carnea]